MNIFGKLKLIAKLNSTANAVSEGIKMKNTTKVVAAIVSLITMIGTMPDVQHAVAAFYTAHPIVAAIVAGISTVLALFHNPQASAVSGQSDGGKALPMILLALIGLSALAMPSHAAAQTLNLTTEADAVAVRYNGGWYAASRTALRLKISNTANVYAKQTVIADAYTSTAYTAGYHRDIDPTKFFKKFAPELSSSNVSTFIEGDLGTLVASGQKTHFAAHIGGGVRYRVTQALTWNSVTFGTGFYGGKQAPYITTGLAFVFGKK